MYKMAFELEPKKFIDQEKMAKQRNLGGKERNWEAYGKMRQWGNLFRWREKFLEEERKKRKEGWGMGGGTLE